MFQGGSLLKVDRVVHAVADDREERRDDREVELERQRAEEADGDEHVVHERDDRAEAEAELEAEADVDEHHQRREADRLERGALHLAADLRADSELDERAMNLISLQLTQIRVLLPAEAVKELQKTPFWIQKKDPTYFVPCYHVSREWLETHGVNPDKTGAIDIPNARYMLGEYDRQPMMLLHELAHAYHFKTVENGEQNASLEMVYRISAYLDHFVSDVFPLCENTKLRSHKEFE